MRLAFVIATKDRPEELRNVLKSLTAQSVVPAEVIVVDASSVPVENVVSECTTFPIKYIRHLPPCA